jgi:hypothetical protein
MTKLIQAKDDVNQHGFKAFYKGQEADLYASSKYNAQLIAAKHFKAKKNWEVSVHLCERATGETVEHVADF